MRYDCSQPNDVEWGVVMQAFSLLLLLLGQESFGDFESRLKHS